MQFLNTEEKPRRAAVINDLSGAGKCSLTVMLPVLSALGCETSVLPTAVLSTHGGFKDPVYRDLTDDMLKTAQHWKREGPSLRASAPDTSAAASRLTLCGKSSSCLRTNTAVRCAL